MCKTLTSRPQAHIANVIDPGQSGFIAGRSISENFVYASEVVQCFFKRKAPTLVLKLDFAKAFDSIDWLSLRKFLSPVPSPLYGATGLMPFSTPPCPMCSSMAPPGAGSTASVACGRGHVPLPLPPSGQPPPIVDQARWHPAAPVCRRHASTGLAVCR
jgi:hypothetical protein